MNEEVLRRLEVLLSVHREDGPAEVYWGCSAHSEGQYCCLDVLTDDESWEDFRKKRLGEV